MTQNPEMPDVIWAWYLSKHRQTDAMKGGWFDSRFPDDARYLLATPAREAADDMLEALQQLLIEYDEVDLAEAEPASFTAAVIAARTAIDRATGAA